MQFAREAGTWLPTEEQHHLLRATLLQDEAAVREALARWQSLVHVHDVDHGSARMLPLLYRNLQSMNVDDPLLPQLKGTLRQTWFRNQLLFARGVTALRLLREQDIDVMLLKGPALATSVYSEIGLRPMNDFDLLVRRDDFLRALALLTPNGWYPVPDMRDLEAHATFQHAISMIDGNGGEIDLHWRAAFGMLDERGEQEFWNAARPAVLGGISALMLSSSDQLLQVCVHAGAASREVPPIRWVADAVMILRSETDRFDWERLVRVANIRRQSLIVFKCLSYLGEGLAIAIPKWVLRRLRADVRNSEWRALEMRSSIDGRYRLYTAVVWRHVVFMDGFRAVPRRTAMFLRFLRSTLASRTIPQDRGSLRRTLVRLLRELRGS